MPGTSIVPWTQLSRALVAIQQEIEVGQARAAGTHQAQLNEAEHLGALTRTGISEIKAATTSAFDAVAEVAAEAKRHLRKHGEGTIAGGDIQALQQLCGEGLQAMIAKLAGLSA